MILAHDVSGSGPLLVLVHGITEDRRSWDPVDLSGSFTVVRVDVRGHGDSEAAEPYDIPTLATDIHDTVAQLQEKGAVPDGPPIVVGHSMGGIVATAYGALFPARAVVNVDQPLHLAGMQQQIQQAEGMLRGEQFPLFIHGMFAQMAGELDPGEVERVNALRAPKQDVVLGMWSPLLDDSPEELAGWSTGSRACPPMCPTSSSPGSTRVPSTRRGCSRPFRTPCTRCGSLRRTTRTSSIRRASSPASTRSRAEPSAPAGVTARRQPRSRGRASPWQTRLAGSFRRSALSPPAGCGDVEHPRHTPRVGELAVEVAPHLLLERLLHFGAALDEAIVEAADAVETRRS